VVNQAMARTVWPGQDALGRCVQVEKRGSPCFTVVGVVENGHRMGVVEKETMQYYLPAGQLPFVGWGPPSNVVVRAAPDRLAAAAEAARRELGKATVADLAGGKKGK
jgi:hypothetical protein